MLLILSLRTGICMVQTICLSVESMIKKVLMASLCAFLFTQAWSQGKVSVQVNNFENNKGRCIICLYDRAKDFVDSGTPVQCETVNIANKNTAAVFENVTAGTYAVLVVHDANNNRKFDTNFVGIPKEGYGASGNKLPFAAAPKFEENKFTVTDNKVTNCNIKLRYIF